MQRSCCTGPVQGCGHTSKLLDGVVKLLGLLGPATLLTSKGTEQSIGTVHLALGGRGIILQSLLLSHGGVKRCLQRQTQTSASQH